MMFKDIPGNEGLVKAFRNMVDTDRVPHAILLHENDGGGAFPLVMSFLSYLYCHSHVNGDSCGTCPECNKIGKLVHPDMNFIFPVAGNDSSSGKYLSERFIYKWREVVASNPYFTADEMFMGLGLDNKAASIGVEEARNLLSKLSSTSLEGGWRSTIIYLPERMNDSAANALLKMIEEPPAQTLFILISHEPEKVIRTISSRCLPMRVIPLSKEDSERLRPTESEDRIKFADLFWDLINALGDRNLFGLYEIADSVVDLSSKEKQNAFCKLALEYLRNIFTLQQGLEDLADIKPEDRDLFLKAASRLPKVFPRIAMEEFNRAVFLLSRNVSPKMLFCDLVGKLYRIC